MIKTIIYDLDDTLFPEESFRKSGFRFIAQYLSERNFPISEKEIETLYVQYPRTLFDELIRTYQLPFATADLIALFREHAPVIEVYPGVKEVLAQLQKDYKLGMITDYHHATQRNKVAALGIEPYFTHIIYSHERGSMKPDVALFEEMKRATGAQAGEILYVGDNEQKDFIGARKAGYYTVKYLSRGVYRDFAGTSEQKADFEIANHREIFTILAKLATIKHL